MPAGVPDLLPVDAALRDELLTRLTAVLTRWGYRRVETPTFELAETILLGLGAARSEETYQFFDRNGRLLVLRPDFTTPLARLAASKLRAAPLPLRLYYAGNLFRRAAGQEGRLHEVPQIGLELMGSNGVQADAEVMAVAADCLQEVGLRDVTLGIGHVGFLESALQEAGLDNHEQDIVRQRLMERDFVALQDVLDGRQVPGLGDGRPWEVGVGAPPEVTLAELAQQVHSGPGQAAVREMTALWRALQAHDLGVNICLDLTLVRDFAYYTGPVCEFYVPYLGVPICVGGRYDGLLGSFGYQIGATGFAIGLNELEAAVQRRGRDVAPDPALDYLIVVAAGDRVLALKKARQLRAQGKRVAVEGNDRPRAELLAYAEANGAREIITWQDGQWQTQTIRGER